MAGHRRAEATPSFGRLRAGGSDAVLRTATGDRKRRRSSDSYGGAKATPSFGRLCPAMTRERLRFARGFIRWHKYHQAKCKSSQQGRGALADFNVPGEIRFVDEMPRSTLEKVAKAELRKMLG